MNTESNLFQPVQNEITTPSQASVLGRGNQVARQDQYRSFYEEEKDPKQGRRPSISGLSPMTRA